MGIKLLLVDDCDFSAAKVKRYLAGWKTDCEITVETDARNAISNLDIGGSGPAKSAPDIIVLDLKMPRIDGFSMLARLREDPRYADLPIVIYSSSEEITDEERCMLLGADIFLSKSSSGIDMHDTLERAICRRWAQRKSKAQAECVN